MEVQRVKYERTGGFAGMRFYADFAPNELPVEESRPLLDLLDKVDFFTLPANMTGAQYPDQFTYTITVEAVKQEHTVVTGDSSAPNDLQELLQLLDRIARSRR